MNRKGFFNGNVYKPMKFGESVQPGTVEWDRARRRERAQNRREDKALKELIARREETAPRDIWRVLGAVLRFFRTPH